MCFLFCCLLSLISHASCVLCLVDWSFFFLSTSSSCDMQLQAFLHFTTIAITLHVCTILDHHSLKIATHDSLLSSPTASDSQLSSLSLWPNFLVASYLQFFALSLWFLVAAAISWNLQLQMLELVCNLNLALMRFVLLGAWKDTITTITLCTLGTTLEEFLDSCDFAFLCWFCSFFVFLTPPKWA